ncbi:transmembrane protein 6/97 [Fusarium flagelliforme]|uniref:EXPERA domain-containing protein n=1 Tax=Fusarium flagelliforme TaxID=2675880 RepID=A0A395MRJ1_9HYPO|nr:transmembrane protein 6/97 [Fusarium flagelliforme]KAH7182493.1 transmembrane protein 6/97 [Fusarium flagelliforme]RFN50556.1 hypothetical protein FIE12Z_5182 [Fusarium flagelliforme]
MAQKPLRDWVYVLMIVPQIFGMIVLDFSEFYPASFSSPSSPLSIIRRNYISISGDPFYGPSFTGAWLHSMYYIELLVQFPLAAYIVWNMASKKPTTGPTELAGLAFGCLTAMGSVACVAELLSMGGDLVSESQKMSLAWGTYAPYAVLPGIMAVDMYMRLLRRVSGDNKSKTQ